MSNPTQAPISLDSSETKSRMVQNLCCTLIKGYIHASPPGKPEAPAILASFSTNQSTLPENHRAPYTLKAPREERLTAWVIRIAPISVSTTADPSKCPLTPPPCCGFRT